MVFKWSFCWSWSYRITWENKIWDKSKIFNSLFQQSWFQSISIFFAKKKKPKRIFAKTSKNYSFQSKFNKFNFFMVFSKLLQFRQKQNSNNFPISKLSLTQNTKTIPWNCLQPSRALSQSAIGVDLILFPKIYQQRRQKSLFSIFLFRPLKEPKWCMRRLGWQPKMNVEARSWVNCMAKWKAKGNKNAKLITIIARSCSLDPRPDLSPVFHRLSFRLQNGWIHDVY